MTSVDAKIVASFKRDGFAVVERAYSPEDIRAWHMFAESRSEGRECIVGGVFEDATELAMAAVAHPVILAFVEKVMGPFVQLDGLSLVSFPPLSRKEADIRGLHWHRDPWGRVPRSREYEAPLAVNALCYLQDLTPSVGPLRVIPGSHRLPLTLLPAQRKVPHAGELLLTPRAGDVALLHHNLVHSRTPNTSLASRYYLSVLYNHSWLKCSTTLSGPRACALRDTALAASDHRLLRLLGLDLQIGERGNSGFLSPDEEMWEEWRRDDAEALRQGGQPATESVPSRA